LTATLQQVCVLAAALAVTFGLLLDRGYAQDARGPTEPLVLETGSGKHTFTVEVAKTDAARTMGLMYRRSMPADAGMLFVYDKPQAIFMWMKNTFIPLDMVFIKPDGRVHSIARDTEPFSEAPVGSGGEVIAVLELNAGTAARIGLSVGDRVVHPAFEGG
jgi:uncharacterized membrane protein (UPF0127 family)